jgi:hypothetical protein
MWLCNLFGIIFNKIRGFVMGMFGRGKSRFIRTGEMVIPAGQNSVTVLLDFSPVEVSATLIHLSETPGYPACQPVAGDTVVGAIAHYAAGKKDEVWGITISWNVAGTRQLSWMAKNYAG